MTAVSVLCLGTFGITFIEPTSEEAFFGFVILYGVSFGICNGLAYIVPLRICYDYFPEKKGMVSGVIIGGFGFGSFLFNFISTALINPDNLSPVHGIYPKEVTDNVPNALRVFAIIWASLAVTSINLLRPKKGQVKVES